MPVAHVNVNYEKTTTKGKAKYRWEIGEEIFAEELALKWYAKKGYGGIWSGNDYWWTIMVLLFWDVVYAKLEDVYSPQLGEGEFPNPIQDMPTDLFTEEFYARRKSLIANRISELRNTDIEEEIKKSFERHYGRPCRPVENWDQFGAEKLTESARHLAKEKLLAIMERLLVDFNSNRRGLPDLFVFGEDAVFVEVKGAGDKISDSQGEWLEFIGDKLDLKAEIFFINQPRATAATALGRKEASRLLIKFGKSTSKRHAEAVTLIKTNPSYRTEGEGDDVVHCAEYSTDEIEDLLHLLDIIHRWKSAEVFFEDERISAGELSAALSCYEIKLEERAGSEYCKTLYYDMSEKNAFGCRAVDFRGFESNEWTAGEYGYFDTQAGEWVFNKDKIKKKLEEEVKRLRFCPLLNEKRVLNKAARISQKIDPKQAKTWLLLTADRDEYFWTGNAWKNADYFDDRPFPGFQMVTGIRKISTAEYRRLLQNKDSSFSYIVNGEVQKGPDTQVRTAGGTDYKPWIIIAVVLLAGLLLCFVIACLTGTLS